jgi:hypothetical protein
MERFLRREWRGSRLAQFGDTVTKGRLEQAAVFTGE